MMAAAGAQRLFLMPMGSQKINNIAIKFKVSY